MCVCVCLCMCKHIYVYTYIYIHTHACINICLYLRYARECLGVAVVHGPSAEVAEIAYYTLIFFIKLRYTICRRAGV